ncbi:MAG: bifunctional ornithine acetyltransferase/N-acetylglutamate synthase, partial [Nannocystaceae bacterium]|nr:bifunctional ornithine acetyltransferase/N-acetylglutamate synthase [Nannocystaceae bacterium]
MSTTELTIHTDLAPSFPVAGFRFAGTRCGIKHARPDLALLVSDRPTVVAGCFTQNRARASCVERNAAALPADGLRAVLVNSGNANAMTGPSGVEDNLRMASAAATALGLEVDTVLTGSTGIIGVPLPVQLIEEAASEFDGKLADDPREFAKAILTTDTCTKVAHTTLELPGHNGPVRLLGIAKGSGMVHPNMATTFGFLLTDAAIAPAKLQAMLSPAVDRTFNAITVD